MFSVDLLSLAVMVTAANCLLQLQQQLPFFIAHKRSYLISGIRGLREFSLWKFLYMPHDWRKHPAQLFLGKTPPPPKTRVVLNAALLSWCKRTRLVSLHFITVRPTHSATILSCWVAVNECGNNSDLTHEWVFAPVVLSKNSKKLWRWVEGSSACLVFTTCS